ncbi:Uncharacterised protein [Candidatus Norongarragalina meridionalis]|nr:Uncharacterised protein [Candidatus Norongarragalina meridionalis]
MPNPVEEMRKRIANTDQLYEKKNTVFEAIESHRRLMADLPGVLSAVEKVSMMDPLTKPDETALREAGYFDLYRKTLKILKSEVSALEGVKRRAIDDSEALHSAALGLAGKGIKKQHVYARLLLFQAQRLKRKNQLNSAATMVKRANELSANIGELGAYHEESAGRAIGDLRPRLYAVIRYPAALTEIKERYLHALAAYGAVMDGRADITTVYDREHRRVLKSAEALKNEMEEAELSETEKRKLMAPVSQLLDELEKKRRLATLVRPPKK